MHDQWQRSSDRIAAGRWSDYRVADGRTTVYADNRCRQWPAGHPEPTERAKQPDGGADERRR